MAVELALLATKGMGVRQRRDYRCLCEAMVTLRVGLDLSNAFDAAVSLSGLAAGEDHLSLRLGELLIPSRNHFGTAFDDTSLRANRRTYVGKGCRVSV